ncbi:hypothetical protein [Soonwooa purpurea]
MKNIEHQRIDSLIGIISKALLGCTIPKLSFNEPSVAEVVEIKAMKPNKALTLNNGKMFKLCTSATILATLC